MKSLFFAIYRLWLKRCIAQCELRRQELRNIVEREMQNINYEEHVLNVKLRELKSRQLNDRLVKVDI